MASLPATDIPNQPRGYALVCSVLALGLALQQAFFSRKPRRYAVAPVLEKDQAAQTADRTPEMSKVQLSWPRQN